MTAARDPRPTGSALTWMQNERLFGGVFGGASWEAARALVAAIFAEPMTPSMQEIYRQCTERTALPAAPFREVWVTAGRRSGKSILTAFLACFVALRRNHRETLAPGEEASCAVYAADRAQAGVLFKYARGLLAQSDSLAKTIVTETRHSLLLNTGARIEIGTRDWRTVRGRTAPLVILEECPVWPADEHSANPDREFLRAVKPSQVTVRDSLLIGIGTPGARRGIQYERMQRYHGTDDPRVLCWSAPTRLMNPEVEQSEIDEAMADDETAARTEFLACWRDDLESFIGSEALHAVCIPDRVEVPPTGQHACFVDSASGGACAYTAAIYHVSAEHKVVIDKVVILDPPLNNPHSATRHVADVCKHYRIASVYGDKYAEGWARGEFAKNGIGYLVSPLVKTDIFLEALPVLLSGACELPDPQASSEGRRLFRELVALERRVGVGRAGREDVSHPRGIGDDAANAVCGALALARRFDPNRLRTSALLYTTSAPPLHTGFQPAGAMYAPRQWRNH
jgi:hypothetical protein